MKGLYGTLPVSAKDARMDDLVVEEDGSVVIDQIAEDDQIGAVRMAGSGGAEGETKGRDDKGEEASKVPAFEEGVDEMKESDFCHDVQKDGERKGCFNRENGRVLWISVNKGQGCPSALLFRLQQRFVVETQHQRHLEKGLDQEEDLSDRFPWFWIWEGFHLSPHLFCPFRELQGRR